MKLKWFLVGLIVAMFFGDWIRLRVERKSLLETTERATFIAQNEKQTVDSCTATLDQVKGMLENIELRTQVAIYSRAQALDLFNRSKRGDQRARELLEELGINPDTHRITTTDSSATARRP